MERIELIVRSERECLSLGSFLLRDERYSGLAPLQPREAVIFAGVLPLCVVAQTVDLFSCTFTVSRFFGQITLDHPGQAWRLEMFVFPRWELSESAVI